jgi:hypothetical protein
MYVGGVARRCAQTVQMTVHGDMTKTRAAGFVVLNWTMKQANRKFMDDSKPI